jgi:hypothetical protein
MSHLDEGQLAALLDDELEPDTKRAVEAHLASCTECQALWEEIRVFASEADRLVASVELPPKKAPALPATAAAPTPGTAPGTRRPLPLRTLAWAATVVLAVGLGYSIRGLSRSGAPAAVAAPADEKLLADRADKPLEPQATTPTAPATDLGGAAAPKANRESNSQPSPVAAAKSRVNSATAARPLTAGDTPASPPAALRDATPPVASPQGTLQPRDALAKGAVPARAAREFRMEEAPTAASGGFLPADLESAVKTLEGSIRLVDGLNPERVLTGPGRLIPGGDPTLEVVRVVYQDPPGRELWLDQQRPRPSTELDRGRRLSAVLPGDTILAPTAGGSLSVRWLDQHGFLLSLTGFLPGDSLRALVPRVH